MTSIHPVTIMQRNRLNIAATPGCPEDLISRWNLSHAVLVSPRIDVRRLERGMRTLFERHDTLRMRFQWIRGDWRAVIEPPSRPRLRQVDLGDQDDADFRASIANIANAHIPLVDSPLAEVVLAHCGARGDVVIMRAHSSVSDGYGMVVMGEDLMKAAIGLPMTAPAVSHAEYLAKYEHPQGDHARKVDAYWQEALRDFPKAPNIGRKAKGLPRIWETIESRADTRAIRARTRPRDQKRLETRAKTAGATVTSTLFAGFLQATCRQYDLSEMGFSTWAARVEPDLAGAICDHTLGPLFKFRTHAEQSIDEATAMVHSDMLDALHHLPADAARPGSESDRRLIEAGAHPRQFTVYRRLPETPINRSVFNRDLMTRSGDSRSVGGVSFSQVPVRREHPIFCEVEFEAPGPQDKPGFVLRYDANGFDEDEMMALSTRICDLLQIEPLELAPDRRPVP